MDIVVIIFLLVWLAFGIVGAIILSNKGRSGVGGFALGIVLGIIGLIIALAMSPSLEHRIKEEEAIGAIRLKRANRAIEADKLERLRQRNQDLERELDGEGGGGIADSFLDFRRGDFRAFALNGDACECHGTNRGLFHTRDLFRSGFDRLSFHRRHDRPLRRLAFIRMHRHADLLVLARAVSAGLPESRCGQPS